MLTNNIIMHKLLIPILLFGCASTKPQIVEKEVIKEVVKVVEKLRDTTVFVSVPFEVLSAIEIETDTSRLETSLAISEAWGCDGRIHHTLRNKQDSLPVRLMYKTVEKEVVRDSIVRNTVTVTVEVEKKLSSTQSAFILLGKILSGILGLGAIFVFLKIKGIF